MEVEYNINLICDNTNGFHIYSLKQGHSISMCPNKIWNCSFNFKTFVEYLIHWQLCERICLESRINKMKSKYRCNSDKYCPMEIPALLMLGHYIKNKYELFNKI